jgi:hypothetical protein
MVWTVSANYRPVFLIRIIITVHYYYYYYYILLNKLFHFSIGRRFSGSFAKLRNETISYVMSVCLSVRPSVRPVAWNSLARTGRIFMKFDI